MKHRLPVRLAVWISSVAMSILGAQAATLGPTVTVIKNSTIADNDYRDILVSCPAGMVALSGGIDLLDVQDMRVTTSAPTFGGTVLFNQPNGNSPAPDGWYASGRNDTGSTQAVTVGVVCSAVSGVSTVVTSVSVAGLDWQDNSASCPAGTIATGGGVDNVDGFNMVVTSHSPFYSTAQGYLLNQSDGSNAAPIGWYGASRRLITGSGTMKVAAVCAPLSGASSVVRSTTVAAGDWDLALATCPSGTTAVGGGIDVQNNFTMAVASTEFRYAAAPFGMWQRTTGQYEAPSAWEGFGRNFDTATRPMKTAVICAPSPTGPSSACTPINVYRYRNTQILGHFYTTSTAEGAARIAAGEPPVLEGAAFNACGGGSTSNGVFPVERFKHLMVSGVYFYSMLPDEIASVRANLGNILQDEGIAFYAFNFQPSGAFPVYRFRNTAVPGANFYTILDAEKASIIANVPGYALEGIGFWAMPPQ